MDKQRRLALRKESAMAKTSRVTVNPEPLVLMASMYDEYLYLDIVFVQKHQCLFGVKAELYNTVKANLDAYEGAYILYKAAYKKYYNQFKYNYQLMSKVDLLDWGMLLYGEIRWCSNKERKDYGIKEYKPKYHR
jgi:hypothetical protein